MPEVETDAFFNRRNQSVKLLISLTLVWIHIRARTRFSFVGTGRKRVKTTIQTVIVCTLCPLVRQKPRCKNGPDGAYVCADVMTSL